MTASLSAGALRGLIFIQKYRHLTINQFASCADFSSYHAAEVLRTLERRGFIGFFGGQPIPMQGRTPKVYFLKRKGWHVLRDAVDDIGEYVDMQDTLWTPQIPHRLKIIDCFLELERSVASRPQFHIVQTLLSYKRVKGGHLAVRETTDTIDGVRLVPDGVFILENSETGNRGLFIIEVDLGSERITAPQSRDKTATLIGKYLLYDQYLQSGQFASTYKAFGAFRSFLMLLVTTGSERVTNIRAACSHLNLKLHPYYRLSTFDATQRDFLGDVWHSRDASDTVLHRLAAR